MLLNANGISSKAVNKLHIYIRFKTSEFASISPGF